MTTRKRKGDPLLPKTTAKRAKKKEKDNQNIIISDNEDTSNENDSQVDFAWKIADVIAENSNVSTNVVQSVINLLDHDNTIPFIARYRREQTGNIDVQNLYDIKDDYEKLKVLRKKVSKMVKEIKKAKKMTSHLLVAFKNVKTDSEFENLCVPFKGSKKTLAERARQLGLEPAATTILDGTKCDLMNFIKMGKKGIANLEEVKTGVQHIIADVISKNQIILKTITECIKTAYVLLESVKSRNATKEEAKDEAETSNNDHHSNPKLKFENYYKFSQQVKWIKSHQVLAINRGENLKMLTVKIIIPENVKREFIKLCEKKWRNNDHFDLLHASFNDAWTRLVEPFFSRQTRSELTKMAEKESIDVFGSNLRQLLLTPPCRGNVVMAIDPGFKHGCKVAVISPTGAVLETDVFYLPYKDNRTNYKNSICKKLKMTLAKHQCCLVGIGNGTASRETESLISEFITNGVFKPIDVKYCIVNECGASIYSVTKEATKELPNVDPNLRSAVSIARRLQDPLAEYVKIDPKHLGVGMYQHDLSGPMLKTALDDIVIECVSFVGVDLNTGSEALLRRVAGLSAARAKNIIQWRNENGKFICRQQLTAVKGMGPKSFEQCAGFVRIFISCENSEQVAATSKIASKVKGSKKSKVDFAQNYLDMTCIHPESYGIAKRFLDKIGETPANIGRQQMIAKVQNFAKSNSIEALANSLNCGIPTLQLIIDGLSRCVDYDMRSEFQTPLFRKGLMSMDDLTTGAVVTGRVANVVHFGAFVDIGVGQDALIHTSKIKGTKLNVGQRVEAIVDSVDLKRKRVGLIFKKLL